MPMSPLPAAIIAHMTAVSNVPPPPQRSIPRLKVSKHINYSQLNALCHMRGLQYSSHSILEAHNNFMKKYSKIFLHKKVRLPKLCGLDDKRKSMEETKEIHPQHPDDSHNIAVHVKKVRGDNTLYGQKLFKENLTEFIDILKKLPVHRTVYEHNIVWKMLKTVPYLTSQLTDEHLKALSRGVISETWIKDSTVVGNEGFYIILKGLARPQTTMNKNLIEGSETIDSSKHQSFNSFISNEDIEHSVSRKIKLPVSMLRPWSTFGTLEIIPQTDPEIHAHTVVTEDDCEILKIPAKEYAKIKLEKIKLENIEKEQLIRKCPHYKEWPTLSIYELIALIKWKKFPAGHELDPVTKQLMLQTAKPTFGHLTEEDVKTEYLRKEQQKEWKDFKDKTIKNSLYYNGIVPGFGKWNHYWTSIPRNLKDTLISYY
ncbi:cyclic nucleotide-binding domain-containing protein 1 isoform X1 [Dasypus novemcinctus]|uniref:cyclic nucleotide-binding domain-containing protein 1 isoform X1 n=1 Tax=Dasypus novemcinctus TaxID=9361 RepID=UPI00265E2601|nr:cyclic nucleotide-binding domain-containing protein 1 isoform X1 [Dasypus novemcinctus]